MAIEFSSKRKLYEFNIKEVIRFSRRNRIVNRNVICLVLTTNISVYKSLKEYYMSIVT